jgi:hypothetical protein
MIGFTLVVVLVVLSLRVVKEYEQSVFESSRQRDTTIVNGGGRALLG